MNNIIVGIEWIILLLGIFCLSGHTLYSQNYASKDKFKGNWESPSTWIPIWTAPQTDVNGHNITIQGYITANGSLSFSGSSKLTVKDTLVIKGNLTINDNND